MDADEIRLVLRAELDSFPVMPDDDTDEAMDAYDRERAEALEDLATIVRSIVDES